jgi:DNA-directed RNA polymerase sigma subunit (sigma70/sigma32)
MPTTATRTHARRTTGSQRSAQSRTSPAVNFACAALRRLTSREERILRLRFGERPQQCKTIGRQFDVTGQRISQIVAGALRKLHQPGRPPARQRG